ncbi:MAG TPA: AMIN domain-containing protein [Terriglobales bacterium]|nr:AMIN domain-containing protein [Terriglobales bacterium]
MARLFYFGALLGIVAVLSAPICAQGVAPNRARVQHVVVRGTGATMEVEIQTSGAPVAPDTQTLAGPDRIVVDFPGALPAAELRALKVNRGALKGVRAGLFFDDPPITRIVLDLAEPQSYHISSTQNAVTIKLGSLVAGENVHDVQGAHTAKLQNASLDSGTPVASARVSPAAAIAPLPAAVSAAPPQPALSVTFENGRLRIRADKATLAQVLFEVQRQTQAEIAIPAGAEQEQVVADLGPASARDVLAALLNGSAYNFIFVGTELTLEQVVLTRRDTSNF